MRVDRRDFERQQLRAAIVRDWLAGDSARVIARRHRVSQANVAAVVSATAGVVEERERRGHQAVQEWSLEHPGRPLTQAAKDLSMPLQAVRNHIGARAGMHPHPAARRPAISPAQINRALAQFTAEGHQRRLDYDAQARSRGWPSSGTIIARHGTWRAALAATGAPMPPRQGRGKKWSDDHLWAAVASYLLAHPDGGWRSFQRWASASDDVPSASLIRSRLGPWRDILSQLDQRNGPLNTDTTAGLQ